MTLTSFFPVHEKKKVFQCESCDRGFTQKSSLKTHFDIVHLKTGGYPCDVCSKVFTTKQMLEYHLVSPTVHNDGAKTKKRRTDPLESPKLL